MFIHYALPISTEKLFSILAESIYFLMMNSDANTNACTCILFDKSLNLKLGLEMDRISDN